MAAIVGQRDELLRAIEAGFPGTTIHVRGNEIAIEGADADKVEKLFSELVALIQAGTALDVGNVGRTIDMVKADERPSEILTSEVLKSARGRSVRPKTSGQKKYVDAIKDNIVTFGIGPAVPARATSPWRWRFKRCKPRTSNASSSRARQSRRGSGSASFPETCSPRSIRTCGRCTTRSTTCSRLRAH